MFTYQVHTIESAPGKSKPALEQRERLFGFVPNIAGAIANSPVLANSLLGLFQNVHGGSFTDAEIQTLLLTHAVTNSSPWAVAFPTALALKEGLDPADVQAIRERRLPKHQRYCSKPLCRKGSKGAAQAKWVNKPGNRHYFRGAG